VCSNHCSGDGYNTLSERILKALEEQFDFPDAFAGTIANDSVPPTQPSNVAVQSVGPTSVTLQWGASTDDIKLRGYEIFLDSQSVENVYAPSTEGTVSDLVPNTQYLFTVKAKDGGGNFSPPSEPVIATTDTLPASAYASLPCKINIAGQAVNGFLADKAWTDLGNFGYTSEGRTVTVTDPVGGTDDDAVYQSVRFTDFGYKIRVHNGQYSVKLLFAEFWRDAAGQRTFSVNINGQPFKATDFDVYGASGNATAHIESTLVTVAQEVINIEVKTKTDDPILSGIIVESHSSEPLAEFEVISPAAGQKVVIGGTETITWKGAADGNFYIDLSMDRGKPPWLLIGGGGSGENLGCCEFQWSVDSSYTPTQNAILRVFDYSIPERQQQYVFSQPFELVEKSDVGAEEKTGAQRVGTPDIFCTSQGKIVLEGDVVAVRIFDVSGRNIKELDIKSISRGMSIRTPGNGIYLYNIKDSNGLSYIGTLIVHER
jgi:hypothetical protein